MRLMKFVCAGFVGAALLVGATAAHAQDYPIREIRTIKGVSGIHVMAYRQEEAVAEVITESGALNGRVPWYPDRSADLQPKRAAS